jgi:DnaJ-class molecular chaperone
MDAEAIRQWTLVLDQLSYYELFRVPREATYDELKYAFHTFCEIFHPDAHTTRVAWERSAINRVFKRGTEAYRVLSSPDLRKQYDAALRHGLGEAQEVVLGMTMNRISSVAPGPQRLVDKLRTPAARPFLARAEELLKKGDPQQAKIQLVLAMHMDPGNPALEAFQRDVEAAVKEAQKKKDAESKKGWKKA